MIEKMDERLRKQLDFVLEVDKEKNIFRQTHLSGHGRTFLQFLHWTPTELYDFLWIIIEKSKDAL